MNKLIPTLWSYDVSKLKTCPFCKSEMYVLCSCGAYVVTEKTRHLPLNKQPYIREVE